MTPPRYGEFGIPISARPSTARMSTSMRARWPIHHAWPTISIVSIHIGLPEEDPMITEVIEDPPENTIPLPVGMGSVEEASALDPRENTIPLPAGMGSVEGASVLDPRENTIPLPVGMGSVEEASALDTQSVPDGAPNASPSQPRMLTRSQSRRAARAGTTLAAEVSTDDDPQSYREAMNSPLQRQ